MYGLFSFSLSDKNKKRKYRMTVNFGTICLFISTYFFSLIISAEKKQNIDLQNNNCSLIVSNTPKKRLAYPKTPYLQLKNLPYSQLIDLNQSHREHIASTNKGLLKKGIFFSLYIVVQQFLLQNRYIIILFFHCFICCWLHWNKRFAIPTDYYKSRLRKGKNRY